MFVRTNCGGANNSIWSGPYSFVTPYQPLCGTYHVGIAQAAPFNRLTNAINRLNFAGVSCPVIFLLDDLTYGAGETFPIIINPINGGSSINTFTLKPNTAQTPSITGSVNNNGLLTLNGSKYVTIDGSNGSATGSKNLTIINTNTGTGAMTVQLTNDASYDTLKNCLVQGATTGAIGVITFNGATSTGNSYNTIYNNSITKPTGANYPTNAIHNQGTAGIVNTGNTISGNQLFDFSQAGFVDEANSSGTTFSGNEIYLSAATNGAKYGVWLQNASIVSMSISANYIHNLNTSSTSGVYGINVQDAGSCTIINNYINLNDNNAAPLEGIWDQLGAGKTSNIYFNTISIAGTVAAGARPSDAFLKSSTGTTNLRDNILYNIRTGGTGKHYAIRYNTTSGLASNVNDIYNSGGTGNFFGNNGAGAGTDRVSLAAWQGATGQDANSLNILPVFASATDLHMNTGSNLTLDNQGTPIAGITKDYDFDTRSATTPDIGADEFGANVPTLRYWSGTDFWNTSNINWAVQTGGPYTIAPWVIDYTANLENTSGTITTSAAVRAEAINVGTTPNGSNLTYNIIPSAAANTLTLTNTATANVATGSVLNIGAAAGPAELYGTNGLIKKGGGLLSLNYQTGATFSGLVQISDGTLQLNAPTANTLPVTSNVEIISTGTLRVSRSQTLNNLNLYNGSLIVDAGQILTINGTFTIVSGTISAAPGSIIYNNGAKLIYAGNTLQNTGNEAVAAAAVKSVLFNNGSWEGVQVNNNIAVATTDTVNGWVDMTGNGAGSYALTGAATSLLNGLTSVTGDGSFNAGSNTIQMTSAAGIKLGMKITGAGIAANTYVIYISGNVLTISAATTAASPGGGTGTTPLNFSFRGGLIVNHANGVGQAIAVTGTKIYRSGARYKFTVPTAGVIYPALPAGVDSAWDVTMAAGIGNRVVLGTASPLNVTDSLNLKTGILVTGNNLLTWSNLPGGALTAPEPTWTANSTNYANSYIATSDVAGVPLNVANATTPFTGNAGFRIRNVTNTDTYFPVGASYLPPGTNFALGTPNRMMINNQSGTPQDYTVVVNYGDIGFTNGVGGSWRVNRIWYVKAGGSGTGKATMRLFFTKRDWTSWALGENEVETGFNYAQPALVQKDYSGGYGNFINLSAPADIQNFSAGAFNYDREIYGQYTIGTSINLSDGIQQFNRFSVVNPDEIVLPVSVTGIKAYQVGNQIRVDWTALNEMNIDHYEVEKSTNAADFAAIGNMPGRNNGKPQNYYYIIDNKPVQGNNFYRIKVFDKNGGITYTVIVVVNISDGKTSITVTPNPVVDNNMIVQMNNLPAGQYSILLYNAIGQQVYYRKFEHIGGSITQALVLPPATPAGTYVVKVFNNTVNYSTKVVVQ